MEYRGSRKSATRSRRSSENTTYYNKPFRWVQVVGSRLLSAFQLLSQCHLSFVSFVHAGHGYMCILFSYRFLRSSTSQEFQTFRVPVFSSGILGIGEQISAKKRATISFSWNPFAFDLSLPSPFSRNKRMREKMLGKKGFLEKWQKIRCVKVWSF